MLLNVENLLEKINAELPPAIRVMGKYMGAHYENTPMQYTTIFHDCKNDNFQMKNCDIFLIFALKHRSWVYVRTPQ